MLIELLHAPRRLELQERRVELLVEVELPRKHVVAKPSAFVLLGKVEAERSLKVSHGPIDDVPASGYDKLVDADVEEAVFSLDNLGLVRGLVTEIHGLVFL